MYKRMRCEEYSIHTFAYTHIYIYSDETHLLLAVSYNIYSRIMYQNQTYSCCD